MQYAGPEILLSYYGEAIVTAAQGHSMECRNGQALFVPGAVGGYHVPGTELLFRTRVPEPDR